MKHKFTILFSLLLLSFLPALNAQRVAFFKGIDFDAAGSYQHPNHPDLRKSFEKETLQEYV